ncbi:MAG: porin family protein [Gemmatimonadetes bacterium]|nr:porin family protein [Gemmatimonadota bacterium]
MQRRFGVLMTVALLAAPVSGTRAQTSIGLITGFAAATYSGSGASNAEWRTAFMGGGVAVFPVGETISIRSEFQVATKGSSVRTETGAVGENVLEFAYIQVPVLVQLQVPGAAAVRPRLFGGISLALPVYCARNNVSCADVEHLDVHSFDVGVLVGGEIEVLGIGIGARYEAGLSPVLTSVMGTTVKHGVLSFTGRYMLRR